MNNHNNAKEILNMFAWIFGVLWGLLSIGLAVMEQAANGHDYSEPTLLLLCSFVALVVALITNEGK